MSAFGSFYEAALYGGSQPDLALTTLSGLREILLRTGGYWAWILWKQEHLMHSHHYFAPERLPQ